MLPVVLVHLFNFEIISLKFKISKFQSAIHPPIFHKRDVPVFHNETTVTPERPIEKKKRELLLNSLNSIFKFQISRCTTNTNLSRCTKILVVLYSSRML